MALTPLQENGVTRSSCLDTELLASYVDGRTTPEQRVEVEAHLARCEDCYFAFSETVQEQEATDLTKKSETPRSPGWWSTPVAAGLAAAAAIVVAVSVVGPLNRTTPDVVSLQAALAELDAASGPYRKFEPRLTFSTTHRELKPALRSDATAEAQPAVSWGPRSAWRRQRPCSAPGARGAAGARNAVFRARTSAAGRGCPRPAGTIQRRRSFERCGCGLPRAQSSTETLSRRSIRTGAGGETGSPNAQKPGSTGAGPAEAARRTTRARERFIPAPDFRSIV